MRITWFWIRKKIKTNIWKPFRKYSHLIFQITKIFTTISANNRPRPTIQALDGSNNNLFVHSIKNCKSKSFHLDFPLFFRTAIFVTELLSARLSSVVLCCIVIGCLQHANLHEDFRTWTVTSRSSWTQHGESCAAVFGNHSFASGFLHWRKPCTAADMLVLWYESFILFS